MPAVTNVKGVEITLLDSSPPRLPSAQLFGGDTRIGNYTAASLAASAVIQMIRLEPGDMVMGGEVYWEALGASTAITVGTSDSTGRFMTSCPTVVAKSALGVLGGSAPGTGRFNVFAGIGYAPTAEQDIVIATADAVSTGALKLVVTVSGPAAQP